MAIKTACTITFKVH